MSADPTQGYFTQAIRDGGFLGIDGKDYDLPQRLSLPVVLIVHQVLIRAFAILRRRRMPLAVATEDQVTLLLRNVIENNLRQSGVVKGFTTKTFEKVMRQQETENYNGTKIRKTPDLVFLPRLDETSRILSTHYGLFCECKPVGKAHPVRQSYCDAGMIRYVNGDYAWAMKTGLMIGYARHGRTISHHLHSVLNKPVMVAKLKICQALKPLAPSDASGNAHTERLHASGHDRDFQWPHGKGPACAIRVYHSWHLC